MELLFYCLFCPPSPPPVGQRIDSLTCRSWSASSFEAGSLCGCCIGQAHGPWSFWGFSPSPLYIAVEEHGITARATTFSFCGGSGVQTHALMLIFPHEAVSPALFFFLIYFYFLKLSGVGIGTSVPFFSVSLLSSVFFEPRALDALAKHSTAELIPSPPFLFCFETGFQLDLT